MRSLPAGICVILAALILSGCAYPVNPVNPVHPADTPTTYPDTTTPRISPEIPPVPPPGAAGTPGGFDALPPAGQPSWKSQGVAIAGTYADAEIADAGNGIYRLYYSIEPEVPGNQLEVFSSISRDGVNWSREEGVRKRFATFPDIVRLPDGRFRMYFQNAGVIKSASSKDGLVWADEDGVRMDGAEAGFNIDTVGAQTTLRLEDGTYIMVYRGAINKKYSQEVPNSITTILFYATSKDGVNFEKKGIALDSRNPEFKGWLDGPEWVQWDDGEPRLYFWSYRGIYHLTYTGGTFSGDAVFDYTTSGNPLNMFPPNPPGDPTLARINGRWFMYYGQHPDIQYAILEEETGLEEAPLPSSELAFDKAPAHFDNASDKGGPYFHKVYSSTSADGLNFVRGPLIADKASVPDVIRLESGRIILYAVDGAQRSYSGIMAMVSDDNASTWNYGSIHLQGPRGGFGGADPEAVILSDGRIRLYYVYFPGGPSPPPPGSGGMNRVMSALSSDGINFEEESGFRLEYPDGTDPDVVRIGDTWFLYLSQGEKDIGFSSSDGLNFTYAGVIREHGSVSNTVPIGNDAWRQFYCGDGGIKSAITLDGTAFVNEPDFRLRPEGREILCDAAPIAIGNHWLMFFKSAEFSPPPTRP